MGGEKFYITTAIPYASRKPHIGNTYEVILTDAIARYKRQRGFDVFFLTGTDEHGQKIEKLAEESGVTPQEYANGVTSTIRNIWDKMNTTYDKFIRTTDDYHVKAVQHIFKKFYDQGDIYKNEYEGWYCVPCESFYTETQLVDGKCPDCGRPVTRTKEESYFFRMSKYAPRLIEYIENTPGFIEPEARKKEMLNNFLYPGLQDLCVSRTSFKWGVPVTFDDKHVVYVWVDALSNYITALGYDVDEKGELYRKYWPCDVHIIGKDIVRFHTIYWPIFLMALGEPLPKKIYGHGWLLFGTDKMSKSKGNVLYADELADKFGVDGVRHYVLSEMPFAADGSITYENMIKRFNGDLANNLGNLVSRTLAMTRKYFDGVIPTPDCPADPDGELKAAASEAVSDFQKSMDEYRVSDALDAAFSFLRRANKYIDETAPWILAKDNEQKGRLGTVLYNLLESIRIGSVLLWPVMPETCEKIWKALATDKTGYDSLTSFGQLEAGFSVNECPMLFARIDEQKFMAELESEQVSAPESSTPKKARDASRSIGIDVFASVELRAGKIVSCEKIKKSDKLLKLQIDLGSEVRQIVSGIAKWYSAEELVGKTVAVVANLAPAKLCGVESQGMILAADTESESGESFAQVVFLPDTVKPGSKIR